MVSVRFLIEDVEGREVDHPCKSTCHTTSSSACINALPFFRAPPVIRKALDSLDWQDAERQALQEGIDAMQEGRAQDFEAFDREFRQEQGLPSDK